MASTSSSSRKSCDACRATKVKCSGGMPCTRCSTRCVDCFYRARKKRIGTRMRQQMEEEEAEHAAKRAHGQEDELPLSSSSSALKIKQEPAEDHLSPPMDQLEQCILQKGPAVPTHERIAWAVFFTIYRNFRTGCCREWFLGQLERLVGRIKCPEFAQFLVTARAEFVESSAAGEAGLPTTTLQMPGSVCSAMPGSTDAISSGGMDRAEDEMRRAFLGEEEDGVARLTLVTDGSKYTSAPSAGLVVEVNLKFQQQFGIEGMRPFGLLPWGADVLCYVCRNEADVLAFLQVCAINFPAGSCQPGCTRTVPSTHTPNVLLATGETVPCLVKCVHRETSMPGGNRRQLRVDMSFEPMGTSRSSDSAYLPLTDLCLDLTLESPSAQSAAAAPGSYSILSSSPSPLPVVLSKPSPPPSNMWSALDSGEALFPELDFGLTDDVFFANLFEYATTDVDDAELVLVDDDDFLL